MNSQNIHTGIIQNIFWDNKIHCKRCYIIFSQTEYYRQMVTNKISDAFNGEYNRDLEEELKYFVTQVNLQCNHTQCVIM